MSGTVDTTRHNSQNKSSMEPTAITARTSLSTHQAPSHARSSSSSKSCKTSRGSKRTSPNDNCAITRGAAAGAGALPRQGHPSPPRRAARSGEPPPAPPPPNRDARPRAGDREPSSASRRPTPSRIEQPDLARVPRRYARARSPTRAGYSAGCVESDLDKCVSMAWAPRV